MYPTSNQCLVKETKGSYSYAVIGIFIITLTIIVGISIVGVWDGAKNGIQQEDYEMPFISENKVSEESSSGIKNSDDLSKKLKTSSEISEDSFSEEAVSGSSDVSVPEREWVYGLDTEKGEILLVSYNYPTDPLPLKVTNDTIADVWVVVRAFGGYEFENGFVKVIQGKSNAAFPRYGWWDNIVGYLDITGTNITGTDQSMVHGWTYYKLTFTVRGPHPIILDSNHIPGGNFDVSGPDNLDKWVDLWIKTTWSGCQQPDQEFEVILAHKSYVPEKIPNSR